MNQKLGEVKDHEAKRETQIFESRSLRVWNTLITSVPAMMMWIWLAAWRWMPPQPEYEQMNMGIYATLRVF